MALNIAKRLLAVTAQHLALEVRTYLISSLFIMYDQFSKLMYHFSPVFLCLHCKRVAPALWPWFAPVLLIPADLNIAGFLFDLHYISYSLQRLEIGVNVE